MDNGSMENFFGKIKVEMFYGKKFESVNARGSFVGGLSDTQKISAYYIGQNNAEKAIIAKAQEQQKKVLPNVRGRIVYEGRAAAKAISDPKQTAVVEIIGLLFSGVTNMEYHLFASYANGEGKRVYRNGEGEEISAPNGWYVPEKHQIWIDLNAGSNGAGTMLYTLTHEHIHDIRLWSAEHYNKLVRITAEAFEKSGKSFEEAVAQKLAQYRKNHPDTDIETAREEVVAETMSGLLRDGKALAEFSEQIYKTDRSLWEKIKDWFKDVIARITKAYKHFEPESEEAKMLLEQKELLEEAQKVFLDAVIAAGENYKNAGTQKGTGEVKADNAVKYEIRKAGNTGMFYVQADRQVITGDNPEVWKKQISGYINEVIRKNQDVTFPTSDGHILLLTGRSAYKLSDNHVASIEEKIRPLMSDEEFALKGRAAVHIDELIQVAKFSKHKDDFNNSHDNDIGEDGFNYFNTFFRDFDGEYYLVKFSAGINKNEETTYGIGKIIKRRFPAGRGSSSDKEALKNGRKPSDTIIYTSYDKSQEVKTAIQVAFEKALKKDAENDVKYQLRDDEYFKAVADGDMETAKRLVDEAAKEAGYGVKAYHGTTSDFTVFDRNKAGGSNGIASVGFWFTESKEGSKKWAENSWWGDNKETKTLETYLKINNPKVYVSSEVNENDLRKINDRIDEKTKSLKKLWDGGLDGKYGYASFDAYVGGSFRNVINSLRRKNEIDLSDVDSSYFKNKQLYDEFKADVEEYAKQYRELKDLKEQLYDLTYSDAYEKFRTDIYKTAGKNAEDANIGGTGKAIYDSHGKEIPKWIVIEEYRNNLLSEGYDGIKIVGTSYDEIYFGEKNTQYVVFDSNQIKSADPVTYDDNGNIIPLSERFNKENPDIRYSLRESVASFNPNSYNGIRLPSEEYARLSAAIGTEHPGVKGHVTQILDNKDGEPAFIYAAFVSDTGLIVLEKKRAKYSDIERTYENAVKETKGFDRYVGEYRDKQNNNDVGNIGIERKPNGRNGELSRRKTQGKAGRDGGRSYQSVSGLDEERIKELNDIFGKNSVYQERLPVEDRNRLSVLGGKKDRLSKELAVLEKEFGEVIREAYRQNIEPNEGLSEKAEKMNAKAAYRLMSEVASVFHVPKETAEEFVLPIIAEMVDKGPAISESEGLINRLYETAYEHTEDYIVDNDPEGTYKNLRNYIRKTPIFVDSGTKADIGDYNSFRKHNMGSLDLVNDTGALSLDEFYDEISGIAPEFFSGSVDGAEQLYELSGFMKDRGRTESIGDFMPKEEFVSWAEDVLSPEMDKLFDSAVGTFLSEADRKETERKKAATVRNAFEAVSERIGGFDNAVKEAKAEGVLAGQMSQGRAMAKEMRRKQDEFDRKAKGYEEAIAKKKAEIAAVRARRDELLEKARTEKKEAVAKLRREARDRLERSIAEVKAEKNEQIQKLRDRHNEKETEIKEKYRDSIKKATEGRHRTILRGKIRKVVNELNDLLLHGGKEKHVPERMKAAVAKALDVLNIFDPAYYDSRIRNLEQKIEQEKDLEKRGMLKFEHAKILEQRENAELEFTALKAAYNELGRDKDAAFDPVVAEKIDAVAAELEHTKFRDMSMSQLEQVYELYTMLKKVISNSNKLFAQEKAKSAAEIGERAIAEVQKAGGNNPLLLKATKGIRGFFWNNEKPIYAFERIGSEALTDMFKSIRRGEDVWARDVAEAKDFFEKAKEKYRYKEWDQKKTFTFETSGGIPFELTVQQMMSI